MSFRRFATGAALAIAGLAAAVGIGLLANSISGDSVGLGAEPLSAGETLAPATVKKAEANRKQRQRQRQRQRRRRNRGGDDRPVDTVAVPPPAPGGTVTTFDDHGADRSGSDDNSGSGSSSSGSGSSGSGSDDSSHSGGSDDSGKIDDD